MAEFAARKLEMSDEEMGKIALAYVRAKIRRGVPITANLCRKIGVTAKETGIKFERASMFAEILCRELVDEAFPIKKEKKAILGLGPAFE